MDLIIRECARGNIWFIVGVIIFLISIVPVLLLWLYQLCLIIKQWINDEKIKLYVPFVDIIKHDDAQTLSLLTLGPIAIGFVMLWLWPIIIFVSLIVGLLYSLRGFTRFRKKVDKALELKETNSE